MIKGKLGFKANIAEIRKIHVLRLIAI